MEPEKANILGVNTAITPLQEVISTIEEEIHKYRSKRSKQRPFFIVTAYSETFLESMSDKEFKRALDEADLVVGDGVSVWAAADYLKLGGGKNVLIRLIEGLRVGIKVLRGEYAQRPVGMRMFEKLMAVKKYKIFLFGGFNKVAERLVRKYGGEWSEEDEKVIEKINNYNPDILFVALGRYKQEKWIAKNIYKLKAAVVMGVGSAFDELAGEGVWHKKTPEWIEKMGLKWLWRVVVDPRHVTRAWRAFPVFPWKVFWQSGRK